MKTLTIAVVGLGRIGWGFHLPKIAEHCDTYKLVAVVDLSEERLREAREKYDVNGYTELAEMIDKEHPDVVTICSPTHLHPEHACTAMRMGCDVFLDKPMAVDHDAALSIAACAEETGRKLMVYQPHRAFPVANQIKALIASGKIGTPYKIKFAESSYIRRNDWQSLKRFGGGMLNNYGAHFIDVLLYITGEKVRRYHCITRKIASAGDADDVVKAVFETESGMILDLDISQAAALPLPKWTILGQYGAIQLRHSAEKGQYFYIRYYDPTAVPEATASDSLAAANRQYVNDIELPWIEEEIPLDASYAIDFYDKAYAYFAENEAPFVPVKETLYVMELIKKCHESAEA